MLKKINDNLYLEDSETKVLDKYKINYQKMSDMKELIFTLDLLNNDSDLDDDDYDELEEVENSLNERNYYNNINK